MRTLLFMTSKRRDSPSLKAAWFVHKWRVRASRRVICVQKDVQRSAQGLVSQYHSGAAA